METKIRALTLHRPWPWAIFHAGKDFENRNYPLPEKFLGEWVAIHAGKKYDDEAVRAIRYSGRGVPPSDSDMPTGIVGLAVFDRVCKTEAEAGSAWATGPCAWHISNKLALALPIPCNGKQGFWKPDAKSQDIMQAVIEGWNP